MFSIDSGRLVNLLLHTFNSPRLINFPMDSGRLVN